MVAPAARQIQHEFSVANFEDTLADPSIATFANGNYIVAYTRDHQVNRDIHFAIVDAAGTAHVLADTPLAYTFHEEYGSAVATSGNLAAVVYTQDIVSSDIMLKIVDSAGGVVAPRRSWIFPANAALPDIATLADGRFVIVWSDLTFSSDVFGRIYDPMSRTFSGDAFPIVTGAGEQGLPTVAGLPDGGFLVTWSDVPAANLAAATVHGRRFDATGAPIGDEFLLDTGAPGQATTAVAANAAGDILAVWQDLSGQYTTDTSPPGIQGQFLEPATEVVGGTPGNDVLQGYGQAEVFNGGKGNDTIFAGGGNDLITGGAGRDLLFGEAGADRFDYNRIGDSKPGGPLRDVIKDFRHVEGDRIDLRTIDADSTALINAGNQRFEFIGGGTFTGAARELRVAGGIVRGDTNGDGIADFEIRVQTGGGTLVAADFFL